jgi:hypothetical protein
MRKLDNNGSCGIVCHDLLLAEENGNLIIAGFAFGDGVGS